LWDLPSRPVLERALDALSCGPEPTLTDAGPVFDGLEFRLLRVGRVGGDQFLKPAVVDGLSMAITALDLGLLDWSSLELKEESQPSQREDHMLKYAGPRKQVVAVTLYRPWRHKNLGAQHDPAYVRIVVL
jgi:hypothetical protein